MEDIVGATRRVADAKAAAIQFEAVKSHLRQTKDGNTLSLVLSQHDSPEAIMLAHIGQRFLCVLVPIDENEQPIVPPAVRDTEQWIKLCGIMCNDVDFQQWLVDQGLSPTVTAEDAAQAVRDFCRVSSRAQFRDKPEALKKWMLLHGAYVNQGDI